MNKLSPDLAMTWLPHTLQTGLFPEHIWTIITWIAFFFKLASLAFAVPILGLIVFDFCLWIWRLNQPQPGDAPNTSRIPRNTTSNKPNVVVSPNGISSARSANPIASQRRTNRSGQTDD
ncbi:hypothetical protein M426DRAFT_6824 [Hypoxylon sp. CI-4A]|nr:hypothetical protein M426DRAFT_6824 [Hypoxylon sp. CI-4A]